MNIFFNKRTQQFLRGSSALVICAFILAPTVSLAYEYNYTSNESWTNQSARIREYRQQSSEFKSKIDALDTTAEQSVNIPILFGVARANISPNFGDPRDGGARTHEGEDIMAVKGTPIVSPTEAVVVRVGAGPSEGNYVYTANPGGETFVYMHLDRIGEGVSTGDVLKEGDLIGYVGNTGNASGGGAHLHFEIHDKDNKPTDPYPRLTGEIPLAEKMTLLTKIMGQTSDPSTLGEFLVTNFRSTFTTAVNTNIAIPPAIATALSTIPAGTKPTVNSVALPAGDLASGSSGTAVVQLQTYLMNASVGKAALALKQAGATGYFGNLTYTALVEYQKLVGISPANGYYGSETRNYILSHPLLVTTPTTSVQIPTPTTPVVITPPTLPTGTTLTLNRYLEIGMTGEDVRLLQKYLNNNGYTVALTGVGSPGNETNYFGFATKAAVIKFQTARGITPLSGYVGPITKEALAS